MVDTPNTHIHDHLLSWLGRDTSIQSGEVRLIETLQYRVVRLD